MDRLSACRIKGKRARSHNFIRIVKGSIRRTKLHVVRRGEECDATRDASHHTGKEIHGKKEYTVKVTGPGYANGPSYWDKRADIVRTLESPSQ